MSATIRFRAPLLGALLAAQALAGDPFVPQVVLQDGDDATIGAVGVIRDVTIDDQGRWYATVGTDFSNPSTNDVLLRDGQIVVREGDDSAFVNGAVIDSWGEIDGGVTESGLIGWTANLDGGGTSSADDFYASFGDVLLARRGDPVNVAGVGVGTTWNAMQGVKVSDDGRALVLSTVFDPTLPGGVEHAAVLFTFDGGGGMTSELIAYPGIVPTGAVEPIEELEFGEHEFGLADNGHTIINARLDASPTADRAVIVDGVVVAREGSDSPVPGRPWQVIFNSEIDVNSHGSWVVTGILQGVNDDDVIIAVDDEVLVREGDVLPGIAPYALSTFGPSLNGGPIHLGDNGNVLYHATWTDPDASANSGLFLNDRLVIAAGDTTSTGAVIDVVYATVGSYALSDDGEQVVARVRLAGGDDAVVTVDVGPWVSLGHGLAGTGGLIPCLVGAGTLEAGDPLELSLSRALPGATTNLIVGFGELDAPFKGGVLVPTLDVVVPGLPVDGNGDLAFATPMPAGAPAGFELFFQFWHPDPQGHALFAASNAIVGTTP